MEDTLSFACLLKSKIATLSKTNYESSGFSVFALCQDHTYMLPHGLIFKRAIGKEHIVELSI